MKTHVNCYYPPINIIDLGESIYVPVKDIYKYTKELYEKGLSHKSIPPQREADIHEFFLWKSKYKAANPIIRKIIDLLMSI